MKRVREGSHPPVDSNSLTTTLERTPAQRRIGHVEGAKSYPEVASRITEGSGGMAQVSFDPLNFTVDDAAHHLDWVSRHGIDSPDIRPSELRIPVTGGIVQTGLLSSMGPGARVPMSIRLDK
jgi:hypothetical protein